MENKEGQKGEIKKSNNEIRERKGVEEKVGKQREKKGKKTKCENSGKKGGKWLREKSEQCGKKERKCRRRKV